MLQEWLVEFLAGLGKLFIHPLFYFSFLLAFIAGMFRVSRERKDFQTRVYDIYQEIRYILPSSLIIGLLLSVVTLVLGLTLPIELLNMIAAVTVIFSLVGFRLLSPAWPVGAAVLLFYAAETLGYSFIPDQALSFEGMLVTDVLLMALHVITEGLLMIKHGWQGTSPRLTKSPRGLKVGMQLAQRLWLVPVFMVLPAGDLPSFASWWPVVSIGAEAYALIWFPFLVGFAQLIKSTLPELAVKATGKSVITLGIASLVLAVAAYWLPLLAVASAVLVILGRIWISWRHYSYESNHPYFFTKQPMGLMIIGILPNTPARKLDLKIGEIVHKVNGIAVRSENQFYEALQKNAAYCKLEVVDVNGQNRFVQGSLYAGEHHELGLLFVEEESEYILGEN